MTDSIFIGSDAGGANPQALELSRANRHGLIAGATQGLRFLSVLYFGKALA